MWVKRPFGRKNVWAKSIHGSLFCGLIGHGLKRLGEMSLGEKALGRKDVGVIAVHHMTRCRNLMR